jgi:hypothetical protein
MSNSEAQVWHEAKAECACRIYAVASQVAQTNMAAVAAAGVMTAEDMTTYREGLVWIASMRAAWVVVGAKATDPLDDANWPAVPKNVAALAARF